jgi:hypothetical protein
VYHIFCFSASRFPHAGGAKAGFDPAAGHADVDRDGAAVMAGTGRDALGWLS